MCVAQSTEISSSTELSLNEFRREQDKNCVAEVNQLLRLVLINDLLKTVNELIPQN